MKKLDKGEKYKSMCDEKVSESRRSYDLSRWYCFIRLGKFFLSYLGFYRVIFYSLPDKIAMKSEVFAPFKMLFREDGQSVVHEKK